MLVNVSYNNKNITRKVDEAVGKPFTLKERFSLKGIGSPKLLRPKGIIVRFRSLLETYALVIPYYKLTVFKGDFSVYSIHKDHYFIKVKADTKAIQKFFRKLLDYKADNAPTSATDL